MGSNYSQVRSFHLYSSSLSIRDSNKHGVGIFATQNLKKDTVLSTFEGYFISPQAYNHLKQHNLSLALTSLCVSDLKYRGHHIRILPHVTNSGRYYNASDNVDESNAEFRLNPLYFDQTHFDNYVNQYGHPPSDLVYVVLTRDVPINREVLVDYLGKYHIADDDHIDDSYTLLYDELMTYSQREQYNIVINESQLQHQNDLI
jgi:hypothetical protein